jgi:hypothetical protein
MRVSLPIVPPKASAPDGSRGSLLVRGNQKLGGDILAFSLPAGGTCPGATDACRAVCYAARGNHCWPSTRVKHEANLCAAGRRDFVRLAVAEIGRRCTSVVRWHVAGDFYSAAYARKVWEVVKKTPDVVHYFYSRSWRVARVKPMLLLLAAEPNVRQWWSCDRDTGIPFPIPEGIKLAWMMSYPEEEQTHADEIALCDLVFRTRRCRSLPAVKVCGVTVCPVENGVTGHDTDCGRCGLCWK